MVNATQKSASYQKELWELSKNVANASNPVLCRVDFRLYSSSYNPPYPNQMQQVLQLVLDRFEDNYMASFVLCQKKNWKSGTWNIDCFLTWGWTGKEDSIEKTVACSYPPLALFFLIRTAIYGKWFVNLFASDVSG